jgi:membrane protein implicated in regulation of membrane protease activity
LFLVIGVLLIGLRVLEHVAVGFVGEVSVAGVTIVPFHMPLLAVGFAGYAVGTAILWGRAKHRTSKNADPRPRAGTSNKSLKQTVGATVFLREGYTSI